LKIGTILDLVAIDVHVGTVVPIGLVVIGLSKGNAVRKMPSQVQDDPIEKMSNQKSLLG
jgi:hypothetical protein